MYKRTVEVTLDDGGYIARRYRREFPSMFEATEAHHRAALAMESAQPEWTPMARVTMTTAPEWVKDWTAANPDQAADEHWENSRYFVSVTRCKANAEGQPDLIHLSIRSQDRSAQHDWRDFQRIKNEIIGPEQECFELYPKESRPVDSSNQFHLWCVDGESLNVGFNQRFVADAPMPNTKQRPFDDPPADCVTDPAVIAEMLKKGKESHE